jgi:hypothetical protein
MGPERKAQPASRAALYILLAVKNEKLVQKGGCPLLKNRGTNRKHKSACGKRNLFAAATLDLSSPFGPI